VSLLLSILGNLALQVLNEGLLPWYPWLAFLFLLALSLCHQSHMPRWLYHLRKGIPYRSHHFFPSSSIAPTPDSTCDLEDVSYVLSSLPTSYFPLASLPCHCQDTNMDHGHGTRPPSSPRPCVFWPAQSSWFLETVSALAPQASYILPLNLFWL
jgi:hypothetical protein